VGFNISRLAHPDPTRRSAAARTRALLGGGVAGNGRLTALSGAILFVLLAVIGVTIVGLHQLIWTHLFIGVVLIGPVVVKLGSTGYRFLRYYASDPLYREKGPPLLALRALAPLVILSTLAVLASGVALTSLHVLGHLPEMAALLPRSRLAPAALPASGGAAGRGITLASVLVGGLLLAVVLIPDFAAWVSREGFHHAGF
jgi:hypothetical protein